MRETAGGALRAFFMIDSSQSPGRMTHRWYMFISLAMFLLFTLASVTDRTLGYSTVLETWSHYVRKALTIKVWYIWTNGVRLQKFAWPMAIYLLGEKGNINVEMFEINNVNEYYINRWLKQGRIKSQVQGLFVMIGWGLWLANDSSGHIWADFTLVKHSER